jgi:hypothetical protein
MVPPKTGFKLTTNVIIGLIGLASVTAAAACPAERSVPTAAVPSAAAPSSFPPAAAGQHTKAADTPQGKTPPKTSSIPETRATQPMDLASLERRLRETRAIGVFTKLTLKNQVEELLEQFKTFHQGQGRATLDDLRERYNLLLLKVLSLLQRDDPPLARDLSASREAIWSILADPGKFSSATGGG